MVVCVKCCDSIVTKEAKKAGWEKVEGGWYCPKHKNMAKHDDAVS